jgi:hypothetical protein
MVVGMLPVNALEPKLRYVRPVSLLISEGIVPIKLLPVQFIDETLTSSPMHVGSVLPVYAIHELLILQPAAEAMARWATADSTMGTD